MVIGGGWVGSIRCMGLRDSHDCYQLRLLHFFPVGGHTGHIETLLPVTDTRSCRQNQRPNTRTVYTLGR